MTKENWSNDVLTIIEKTNEGEKWSLVKDLREKKKSVKLR